MINKLSEELKIAMKKRDVVRVSVLRGLISELKNKKIDLSAKCCELTDDEALKVIVKESKKRKDSIEAFQNANRTDLVDDESAELKIIEEFLPKQMSVSEIESIVDSVIAIKGVESGFGVLMGAVMVKIGGRADGNIVKEVLTKKLS